MVLLGQRRRSQTLWKSLSLILLSYSSWNNAQPGNFPDCISPWDLLDNNGHQPCQTLQEQLTICTGVASIYVDPVYLEPSELYSPSSDFSSIWFTCDCTEAMYNLFQACAACQNASNLSSRQAWFKDCPMSLSDIPIKTANMADNTFWVDQVYNPVFSLELALQSEQTHQPPNTTSAINSSSTTQSHPQTSLNTSSSSSKINIGVIVGPVIAGLVLIGMLIIFFVLRRRRARKVPEPVKLEPISPEEDKLDCRIDDGESYPIR